MTTRLLVLGVLLAHGCVVIDDGDDEIGSTDSSDTSSDSSETSSETDTTTDTTTDESDTTESDTAEPPASCEGVGSSDLEGVCIWFPTEGQSWTLAEVARGVTIPYQLIVESEIDNVVPLPQDAGGCGTPDESGLILFAQVSGGGQQYCECDTGLCPAPSDMPATLPAGTRAYEFEWTGVNWSGPSDTNQPFGPAFPAGEYVLEVSAIGKLDGNAPFEVRNDFMITLTE